MTKTTKFWRTPSIEFKLQDLWIGAYFDKPQIEAETSAGKVSHRFIYICIVPCLPIKLTRVTMEFYFNAE